jgi:outer membrane immunogenic protein
VTNVRIKFAGMLVAAVSLGMAQCVYAADMPVKARKAQPVFAPNLSWTGCYVGAHLGYSWSSWKDHSLPGAVATAANPVANPGDPIVFGYNGDFDTDGFAGGFQGGCDRQYGSFVVGAVLDFSWASQSADSATFAIVPGPVLSPDEVASVELKYFGTARARLGYVYPTFPALFYVTGGLAWARASMSVSGTAFTPATGTVPFAVSDTTNFLGWTIGFGVDWRFAPDWTAGLEYLHLDFGDANFRFGSSFPNITTFEALSPGVNMSLTTDIVRATVNRRF